MKANSIKKLMACALAVSLVMAPVLGVSAATVAPSTSEPAASTAAAVTTTTTSTTVAGVKSTVGGVFTAKSVGGVAVSTATSSLAAGYGLASNEKPYAKVSDMDPKKSYAAKAVIDLAAASQGAEVGPMLNIELGKMTGGKYSLLSTEGDAIRLSVAVPAKFAQANKTFAVVRVRAGGACTILQDVDDNPNTVTFDTTGGAGAYAIIKY